MHPRRGRARRTLENGGTPLGVVRQELARLHRHPRKSLGQHFLSDPSIAERIIALTRAQPTNRIVEIGPGLGALTDLLVERCSALWSIEVDDDFAERLRARYADRSHVHIVHEDVLAVDFPGLLGPGTPAIVVGNLPYNIATAVLERLLATPHCFARMVLMVQREVAERLRAQPGVKAYSALSVFTQLAARVEFGLRVRPGAFVPQPRVDSEVVIVEPYRRPPVELQDPAAFDRIVRTAFNQRRKQLGNSLRSIHPGAADVLRTLGIDPARRPETLTLAEFAAIANASPLRQAAMPDALVPSRQGR